MTTSVRVHVNGAYRATVKHNEQEPVVIGPQEEKFFTAYHGQTNTFVITEEAVEEVKVPVA